MSVPQCSCDTYGNSGMRNTCSQAADQKKTIAAQAERIKELEASYEELKTLHENEAFNTKYFKTHYEVLGIGFNKQSSALKLAKDALESSLTACISFSALRKANEALAAIDALGEVK